MLQKRADHSSELIVYLVSKIIRGQHFFYFLKVCFELWIIVFDEKIFFFSEEESLQF